MISVYLLLDLFLRLFSDYLSPIIACFSLIITCHRSSPHISSHLSLIIAYPRPSSLSSFSYHRLSPPILSLLPLIISYPRLPLFLLT